MATELKNKSPGQRFPKLYLIFTKVINSWIFTKTKILDKRKTYSCPLKSCIFPLKWKGTVQTLVNIYRLINQKQKAKFNKNNMIYVPYFKVLFKILFDIKNLNKKLYFCFFSSLFNFFLMLVKAINSINLDFFAMQL